MINWMVRHSCSYSYDAPPRGRNKVICWKNTGWTISSEIDTFHGKFSSNKRGYLLDFFLGTLVDCLRSTFLFYALYINKTRRKIDQKLIFNKFEVRSHDLQRKVPDGHEKKSKFNQIGWNAKKNHCSILDAILLFGTRAIIYENVRKKNQKSTENRDFLYIENYNRRLYTLLKICKKKNHQLNI